MPPKSDKDGEMYPTTLSWETEPGLGTFFSTLGYVLIRPTKAFATEARGDFKPPLVFVLVMMALSAAGMFLAYAAAQGSDMVVLQPGQVPYYILFFGLFLVVYSALLGPAVKWLGGPTTGYSGNFRLMAYTYFTMLALPIPNYGPWVTILWWLFVMSLAVGAARGLGRIKSYAVTLLSMVMTLVVVVGILVLLRLLLPGIWPTPPAG